MTNPLCEATAQLEQCINAALAKCIADDALPDHPIPPFSIEIPSDPSHGDFACNVAMVSAKAFSMPPRNIAQILQRGIQLQGSYFDRCEVAGPGFLNFFVSDEWFASVLQTVLHHESAYGRSDFGAGQKVIVEFVSANPTGPMHIGNARGGATGDCLSSVLEWAGYEVFREFYVNDAGNQIHKLAISLESRYLQLYNPELPMPEGTYLGEDITQHVEQFHAQFSDRYLHTSSAERQQALVAFALPKNMQRLKEDLLKYRIQYDHWFLESGLHESGEVDRIIALLKQTGYTYEREGALWLHAQKLGADQDFVLVRANGVPTYVVPDIAYHYNKLVTRGFDRAINVLGADHHGYIPRLKAALKALDLDVSRLDTVLLQMVRLVRDGQVIKASKRSGKAITLVTLLDEVPIDAARLLFNLRESNTPMDFDLDLAIEQTSENPVYYLQYAHARICSILAKLEADGVPPQDVSQINWSVLCTSEERELIRHIAKLPNEIIESAKQQDPSRIAKYALALATLFHKFYNACPVRSDDPNLVQARRALCVCVKTTLHNTHTILSITAPERM